MQPSPRVVATNRGRFNCPQRTAAHS